MSLKVRNISSQRANQIAPSGIRKFFDLLASMEGVISLGVGEPDFATPVAHPRGGYLLAGEGPDHVYLKLRHARASPRAVKIPQEQL